jgi:photosystem II stability/assembly factor-like uncharacterized protein
MKILRLIPILLLILTACTTLETPLPPTDSAPAPEQDVSLTDTFVPPTEEIPPTDTPEPTDTLAPYEDDTPSPPTIAAPIVSAPSITFLQMLSELDGWAVSENAILRTTDGGATWYNVSPQGGTEFGYGTAKTFLNASQAWVIVADASDPAGSGLLYRTDDGGLNWTVYPVPFGGGDMVFTDENNGWMMAFLGVAAGSMAVSIYKTDDGGATWRQTYTNDPNLADASDSLPFGGIKSNLTALDADTAWVGGVIYAPETFYLYKTTDGGQTWATQTIPAAPGMQNTEVAINVGPIFTSPDDAILPIQFAGETYRTGFYATHDGGVSWEFVSFMPGSGDVDFVSPSDGFFWTGEQFFVTVDGAQTWTSVNSNAPFAGSFAGMDFVNTRTGWVWTYDVTGQYGLYKTTDGGATWFLMEN